VVAFAAAVGLEYVKIGEKHGRTNGGVYCGDVENDSRPRNGCYRKHALVALKTGFRTERYAQDAGRKGDIAAAPLLRQYTSIRVRAVTRGGAPNLSTV
jgi:hypothetical protein